MKIFFSAGEPSGDLHGANLIRQLRTKRPDVQCVGYGGPLMAEAGCELHEDLTALAVMWILRALLNLHKFLMLAGRADRYFRHHRPDAVVLIDFPGFNWWIAWRAKAHGIPVFYYAPPQIWAWAQHRVKKMRRLVDHVLCSLPFEETWLKERGCNATFVGHPYFDEVRQHRLNEEFIDKMQGRPGQLVTLLPGSRTQEVTANLRWFLRAAAIVRVRVPGVRFAVAAFKPQHAQFARDRIRELGLEIDVFVRRTPELIHLADCCMAVSGSVSLELLYHKKPTVILYYIGRLAFWVQSRFRRVKYITLVNLLAAKDIFIRKAPPVDDMPDTLPQLQGSAPSSRRRVESDKILFPEYLTCDDMTLELAAQVIRWLLDEEYREGVVAELAKLKARVAHGGASRIATDYILAELAKRPSPIARPHFMPEMIVASSEAPLGRTAA